MGIIALHTSLSFTIGLKSTTGSYSSGFSPPPASSPSSFTAALLLTPPNKGLDGELEGSRLPNGLNVTAVSSPGLAVARLLNVGVFGLLPKRIGAGAAEAVVAAVGDCVPGLRMFVLALKSKVGVDVVDELLGIPNEKGEGLAATQLSKNKKDLMS